MSLQIEKFEMRAFGPFKSTTLDLGAGGGALHVICGSNEVGKSTAQRAIGDFLFGIPNRSPDGHEHGFEDMRLAATVVDGDGKSHQLVRRKGRINTLLDPDGNPVDEGLLVEMLAGLGREAFASMFSITHESLVVGGQALLAADGNVAESLFSASLGAAGLHALRGSLREDADKLFRPKASSTQIAQTRSALQTAESRLSEATLRATPYLKLGKDLATAKRERQSEVGELEAKRQEQRRRERLGVVLPKVIERAGAVKELDSLVEVPTLPHDSKERRLRVEQDLINHRQRVIQAEGSVEHLSTEAGNLTPDHRLLQREQTVEALTGRLENAREAKSDLERQSTKAEVAQTAARRVLNEVDSELNFDEADRLKVTDLSRAEVAAALQSHSAISTKLAESENEQREAGAAVRDHERQLKAIKKPEEIGQLRIAIDQARPHSHVEDRIAEGKARLDDAKEDLQLAMAELQPPAPVESLLEPHWPDSAAVDEFILRDDRLAERERDLLRAREQNKGEAEALDAELRVSTADDALPDEQDLAEARSSRESLWARVRGRLEGRSEDSVDPDEFEGRIHAADRIADRLREEADDVAARAQLDERRATNESGLAEIEKAAELLEDDRRSFETDWKALWEPSGLEPRGPKEMKSWLGLRSLAIERSSAVRRIQRELEGEESLLKKHVSALHSALQHTSPKVKADGADDLNALLAIAERRVDSALKIAEKRDRLENEIDSLRADVEKHGARASERRAEMEAWRAEWAELTSRLGWPEEIEPGQASEQLERVVELTNHLGDAEQSERRSEGIRQRIAAFESDVAQLLDEIDGHDLADREAADAVADLGRQLDQAREAKLRRQSTDDRLAAAQEDLDEARLAVKNSEAELSGLMEQAGVTEPEELVEVELRSARANELREKIPRLEAEIVSAGKGPFNDLVAACDRLDVDQLEARSQGAEEEIKRIEESLRDLDVRIGALASDQRRLETARGASVAGQEVEYLRAELRAQTDHYLRAHVASWALNVAIDDYRRTHKAPLLERAEELFPRLTDGKFKGLEVTFDANDEPVLVGIQKSGKRGKRVSVKGMSDGAREQLYLSLRQASIERHIELHGAVPVILDDVVLHSDPNRKRAILRSLAELSERTQVITFTHDPQVIALAQTSVHPELLTIHEFGDGEITGALQSEISKAEVRRIHERKAA